MAVAIGASVSKCFDLMTGPLAVRRVRIIQSLSQGIAKFNGATPFS